MFRAQRAYAVIWLCTLVSLGAAAFLSGCSAKPALKENSAAVLPTVSGPLTPTNKFHTPADIRKKLTLWRTTYGKQNGLIKVVSLGKTHQGRDIYAMKISRNAATDDRKKPDILLTGCIHGNEWIAAETMMYFAERLLKGYGSDDYITYVLDNAEIWIVPVANPDGFAYSHKSSNDRRRLWRKNRAPLQDGGRGVDLNRSFPHKWRLKGDSAKSTADDIGGSDNPDSKFYRGSADARNPARPAVIQKEIKALINLVDNPRHNFAMFLDYHSFSEKILYPPSHTRDIYSKDMETLRSLAEGMAEIINNRRGKVRPGLLKGLFSPDDRYEALQSSKLYTEVCSGSSVDFFYETRGLISLGIELSPGFSIGNYTTGKGYKISADKIVPVGEENLPALLLAADWIIGPAHPEKVVLSRNGKTLYEARWDRDGRLLESACRTLSPGAVEVKFVFSKPIILHPSYALPREWAGVRSIILNRDKKQVLKSSKAGRWSKTRYTNDTFTASIVVPEGSGDFPVRASDITIRLRDSNGLDLDLEPSTRAFYVTGSGLWLNYERTRDYKQPINQRILSGRTNGR